MSVLATLLCIKLTKSASPWYADSATLRMGHVEHRGASLNWVTGRPELLKEINRRLVFDILKNERSVSRPQLARQTNLSRATIAVIVDELLKRGLVTEVGLGSSSGGRPPVMVRFNPDAAFAVGACMHEYDWSLVVTNLDAMVQRRVRLHIPQQSPQAAIRTLHEGIERITVGIDPSQLLPAVGLGTPGLVDIRTGVIKLAADIGWQDIPFREMAEQALERSVFIANRSKVGALAELWYGADRSVRDLIYISIGTGVAAGIIHQGELLLGANSSAGELGHVTILPDGPMCPCGNRGCLQQLVSEAAIANIARERMRKDPGSLLYEVAGHHPELISAIDVFQAAERGDRTARETLLEVASYLGMAVANLVDLLNPELILLGGPVGEASPLLADMIREEVRRRAMAYPLSAVQITQSSLGPEAGPIGASVLVLQRADELFFSRCMKEAADVGA